MQHMHKIRVYLAFLLNCLLHVARVTSVQYVTAAYLLLMHFRSQELHFIFQFRVLFPVVASVWRCLPVL